MCRGTLEDFGDLLVLAFSASIQRFRVSELEILTLLMHIYEYCLKLSRMMAIEGKSVKFDVLAFVKSISKFPLRLSFC